MPPRVTVIVRPVKNVLADAALEPYAAAARTEDVPPELLFQQPLPVVDLDVDFDLRLSRVSLPSLGLWRTKNPVPDFARDSGLPQEKWGLTDYDTH